MHNELRTSSTYCQAGDVFEKNLLFEFNTDKDLRDDVSKDVVFDEVKYSTTCDDHDSLFAFIFVGILDDDSNKYQLLL